MVTLFNLFTGFAAMLIAARGDYKTACALVLLSIVWDSLDGNIARIFKNTSQLGKEIDSLADLVSFVVAPAFILAQLFLGTLNHPFLMILFVYLGAGTLRLAIFNLSAPGDKDYFTGLPTPAAAVMIHMVLLAAFKNGWAGMVIFDLLMASFVIVLSFLMVSKVRYPKLTAMKFSRWKSLLYLDLAFSALVCNFFNFETAAAASPLFFLLAAPFYCSPVSKSASESQSLPT